MGSDMKRSILIFIVILAACAGGIVGAMVTIRFLDFSTVPYNSIEERQRSVLTAYTTDTSYNVPKE